MTALGHSYREFYIDTKRRMTMYSNATPRQVHNRSNWRARSAVILVIAGLLVLTSWTGARGVHATGTHAAPRAGSLADIINLPYPPMEFSNPGSSRAIGF